MAFTLPTKRTQEIKTPQDLKDSPDYPPVEFQTHNIFLEKEKRAEFEKLVIGKEKENVLDKFLSANIALFDTMLDNIGHHDIWVIPKQQIRLKFGRQRGLIPDFLVCGKNSDGFQYWVVEIKGADEKLLIQTKSGELYFTSEANKGICQLVEYIDFCREHQAFLRDNFRLIDFREPYGMLILGTEDEFIDNPVKQKFKAAWNRLNKPTLEIRTYSNLLNKLKKYSS